MLNTREHIKYVTDTMSALSPAERKKLFEGWERNDPVACERIQKEQRVRWMISYLHLQGKLR